MHRSHRPSAAWRRVRRRSPLALLALAALVGAVALAGCSRKPVTSPLIHVDPNLDRTPAVAPSATPSSPQATDNGLFVDLSVGNHAEFARIVRIRVTDAGSTVPGDWFTVNSQVERTITGTEVSGSETYTDEVESFSDDQGNRGSTLDLWREDKTGLYLWQADVPVADGEAAGGAAEALAAAVLSGFERRLTAQGVAPARRDVDLRAAARLLARAGQATAPAPTAQRLRQAGAAPGGIAPHEITFLRYPLRPGASWEGRIAYNRWTVEAREPLLLPAGRFAAVRLRIEVLGAFGPHDRYATWYAAPGEVAHQAHLEAVETDSEGNVLGTLEMEDLQQLTQWEPAARL